MRNCLATMATSAGMGVRFNFHEPLGGYMKDKCLEASSLDLEDASDLNMNLNNLNNLNNVRLSLEGPPMFGFTRRRVKKGQLDTLCKKFDRVCELWYKKRIP